MSTNYNVNYPGGVPYQEFGYHPAVLHFNPFDSAGVREPAGYIPRNLLAELFNNYEFPIVGNGLGYDANLWTVTAVGTGAAVADAAVQGGGVLLTAGSTTTFNTTLQSKQPWTPVAAKRMVALWRIIPSSITAVGWEVGFGASNTDPMGVTDMTDYVTMVMAVGGGAVVGTVRGASGTKASSATLQTMTAGVEGFFGFDLNLNATAGNNVGGFFQGTSINSYTYTTLSGAQQTQAAAILTNHPNLFWTLAAKGSAGNPTVQVISAVAYIGV